MVDGADAEYRHPHARAFRAPTPTDLQAVEATVSQPWSNGPVEGQIHRLKMRKRKCMVGLASGSSAPAFYPEPPANRALHQSEAGPIQVQPSVI